MPSGQVEIALLGFKDGRGLDRGCEGRRVGGMKNLRYLRGLDTVPKWLIFVAVAGIATTWGEPKPFPTYPAPVNSYLKRVQQGKQVHAFTKAKSFAKWQKQAREALI